MSIFLLRFRFADGIICNSKLGLEIFSKKCNIKDNIYLVYNGFDVLLFNYSKDRRFRFRVKHKISEDCYLIGLVCRVDVTKGHDTLSKLLTAIVKLKLKLNF